MKTITTIMLCAFLLGCGPPVPPPESPPEMGVPNGVTKFYDPASNNYCYVMKWQDSIGIQYSISCVRNFAVRP